MFDSLQLHGNLQLSTSVPEDWMPSSDFNWHLEDMQYTNIHASKTLIHTLTHTKKNFKNSGSVKNG